MKNKYSAKECFRNFRFHSIFWKNLLLVFSTILLPFVCALIISTYTYNELQSNETRTYSNELLTRASMDVESLFKEAKDAAVLIGMDEDVCDFINSDGNGSAVFYSVVDIAKYLSLVNLTQDAYESIYVFSPHSGEIISTAGQSAYENYPDQSSINYWDPHGDVFQIRYLPGDESGVECGRIGFYFKPQFSLKGRNGCIVINYDTEGLDKKLSYGADVRLMLLHNGQVIYDSTRELSGTFIEHTQELTQSEESRIALSKDLEQFGIKVILWVDSRPLYKTLEHIRLTMILLILSALLTSILVVFYISRKVFDPISEILSMLEESEEQGDVIQTKDEISYIRQSVNTTISKNKDIEAELSQRLRLLKKAQSVALQAQINPHFMYNTIDTINWMAINKIGKENEVSKMLSILSQLLRYSLGNTDTFVTLEEEINYAKKYLMVQQIRCNYGFEVFWNVPEELSKCKIIKMTLQPVVENAIKYGIKPFGNSGSLEICVNCIDDIICISIRDSGFGLSQEEVDEINRNVRDQVIKESDHIGLSNVNQRIILMFGDQYGLTVKSRINEGTTVDITIPYLV